MPAPVIELAEEFRAAVNRRDAEALRRLINAYGSITTGLSARIEALVRQIGDLERATPAQVRKLNRYSALLEDAAEELRDFQGFARVEMSQASREALEMGEKHARQLAAIQIGDIGVAAEFNRLPSDAIETLTGFLSPGSPLSKRLEVLAPTTVARIEAKLLEGVALGFGPRKLARQINQAFGMGLTDALRMTRTVQLYSYREANRASYIANSDVVEGWYWFAQLGDGRTCLSCISQHGTLHPNDETLNDHHNGRCTMVPAVVGVDNPIEQSGQEWFSGLSAEEQKRYMGPGKHEAFQDGQFDLSAAGVTYDDPVYGTMRREASLKELVP